MPSTSNTIPLSCRALYEFGFSEFSGANLRVGRLRRDVVDCEYTEDILAKLRAGWIIQRREGLLQLVEEAAFSGRKVSLSICQGAM